MDLKRLRIALALVMCSGLLATGGARAAEVSEELMQIVQQLGAGSFEERELAARQLQQMGQAARPALEQGLASENVDVSLRCEELLDALRIADPQQRRARFVEQGLEAEEQVFELWQWFEKKVGSDLKAERPFIDLYKFDKKFLDLARTDPQEARKVHLKQLNAHEVEVSRWILADEEFESLRPNVVGYLNQMRVLNIEELEDLQLVQSITFRFDGTISVVEEHFKARVSALFRSLLLPDGSLDIEYRTRSDNVRYLAARAGMTLEFQEAIRPGVKKVVKRLLRLGFEERHPKR